MLIMQVFSPKHSDTPTKTSGHSDCSKTSGLMAFRKNTNLKKIIGSNMIQQIKKIIISSKLNGECLTSFCSMRTFCCKQFISSAFFKSHSKSVSPAK